MKLLLHPLLIIAVFLHAHLAGNGAFDILWIKVAVLFTCLPIAANAFAMSEYYGVYSGRSATAIMVTTLRCVTVPAFLYLIALVFGTRETYFSAFFPVIPDRFIFAGARNQLPHKWNNTAAITSFSISP